jgi:hypothetical protein
MNCDFCIDGVQTRFEAGRGWVELPCSICNLEAHKEWAKNWKSAPKPEAPKVQGALFEEPKQEAF